MKKAILITVVFFLALFVHYFTAMAQTPCTPPPNGMVSWWPLDGNATDIQDGNPGVLEGVGGQFVAGKVSLAFSSGGPGSLVRVEDSASLDVTQFTIDAWVRIDSIIPEAMEIIWKGNSTGSNITSPYSIGVWCACIPSITPGGVITGSAAVGKLYVILSDGISEHLIFSNSVLPTGTFKHVAVTVDGSHVRIYIDGNLDLETAQLRTPFDSSFPFQIGGLSGGTSNSFSGLIDEVEIYNRALSATEIQPIFNAGSAGKCHKIRPTAISLASFTASVSDDQVLLEWTTGAEIDNEGFNILRGEAEGGPYTKINDPLIPAKAISPGGESYKFVDTTVENGKIYFYKLEDLDTSGKKTEHGPLKHTALEGNTASLDTSAETSTGAVTSDTSGESNSWFGCGFIKPTGGMRPPSSGEIAGTLLVLSIPFLWVLARRLWRYRRSVMREPDTLPLETH